MPPYFLFYIGSDYMKNKDKDKSLAEMIVKEFSLSYIFCLFIIWLIIFGILVHLGVI